MADQIDSDGFRANVGIIVSDQRGGVLLGGRIGQSGWQFPQGGILRHENPQDAMYRELEEEIGLLAEDVEVLSCTSRWLRYRLPDRYVRRNSQPICRGQKQRWFMLRLLAPDEKLNLSTSSTPEFDRWRWVDFWQPVKEVIYFKRQVYNQALADLAPVIFPAGPPPRPAWLSEEWLNVDQD